MLSSTSSSLQVVKAEGSYTRNWQHDLPQDIAEHILTILDWDRPTSGRIRLTCHLWCRLHDSVLPLLDARRVQLQPLVSLPAAPIPAASSQESVSPLSSPDLQPSTPIVNTASPSNQSCTRYADDISDRILSPSSTFTSKSCTPFKDCTNKDSPKPPNSAEPAQLPAPSSPDSDLSHQQTFSQILDSFARSSDSRDSKLSTSNGSLSARQQTRSSCHIISPQEDGSDGIKAACDEMYLSNCETSTCESSAVHSSRQPTQLVEVLSASTRDNQVVHQTEAASVSLQPEDSLALTHSPPVPAIPSVLSSFPSVRSLSLSNCRVGVDDLLKAAASLSSLQHLSLKSSSEVTDKGVKELATATGLTSLHLRGCSNVTDAGIGMLTCLTSLSSLSLVGTSISDLGVVSLTRLSSLTTLNLGSCSKTRAHGLRALVGLKNLTRLDLRGCMHLTEKGFRGLAWLSTLQHLDLSYCDQATDVVLRSVGLLSNLKSLNLGSCREIGDGGMRALRRLSKLEILNLELCEPITDDGIRAVAMLQSLTSLNLNFCRQVGDRGLMELAALTKLRSLSLFCCKRITDDGLRTIYTLTSLTHLDLHDCTHVTDAGVWALLSFTRLVNLTLYGEQVTDEGIKAVATFPKLTNLKLIYTQVTDKGLKKLSAMSSLTSLSLLACTRVSSQGVEALPTRVSVTRRW